MRVYRSIVLASVFNRVLYHVDYSDRKTIEREFRNLNSNIFTFAAGVYNNSSSEILTTTGLDCEPFKSYELNRNMLFFF